MKSIQIKTIVLYTGILAALLPLASCNKLVDAGAPKTELSTQQVFSSDALATGAIAAIYADMRDNYAGGGFTSLSPAAGALADEMQTFFSQDFFNNNVLAKASALLPFWNGPYKNIFQANAAVEGLTASAGVTDAMKKQLLGEAKFIRAFSYFYLVNLFGDVPLILSTDYKANSNIARAPSGKVYDQVVADLLDAQSLLASDYSFSFGEKVRANKYVATALLARVYLYRKDWANAEQQATTVINNTDLYSMCPLSKVFLKNSTEAIWQLSYDNQDAQDKQVYFYMPDYPPIFAAFSTTAAMSFEPGDQRKINWLTSTSFMGTAYWYPVKYKGSAITAAAVTEYSMVMRLAEQYLIRAEARAQQNSVTGANSAAEDIDVIRNRAGLQPTTASNQSEMLLAIEAERRHELFLEWGHRWLDLKRTDRATSVLGNIKPGWSSYKELLPIPQSQLDGDPAMAGQQNPGYTQ